MESVSSQMDRSTMDSGMKANPRVLALKYGLMVVDTKVTGIKGNL